MFLTVHSTTAIALTQNINNPAGAFFIGLLSHYILDSIPHGDEIFEKLGIKGMAKLAILDHIGVIIILTTIFLFKPDFIFTPSIIFAIIGAMLPDWIMGTYELLNKNYKKKFKKIKKILEPLHILHNSVHCIIKYNINFPIGIIFQIIFLAGFWWLI